MGTSTLHRVNDQRSPGIERVFLLVSLIEQSFHDRTLDQLDSLLDPDLIVHGPFPMEQGADGFRRSLAATRLGFPDIEITIEAGAVLESLVFRKWQMVGTHQGTFLGIDPTGRRVKLSGVDIERIEDDRIVEHWSYWDRMSLAEQLGVATIPGSGDSGSRSHGMTRRTRNAASSRGSSARFSLR
jgi:predicted ester cyclase